MKITSAYAKAVFLTAMLFAFSCLCLTPCHSQTPLFYALTSQGGSDGEGTIISFNPATNTDTVVWSFGVSSDTNGLQPHGNLVYDATNQLFYGMASAGGKGYGTLFSFDPSTSTENQAGGSFGYSFTGEFPNGSLVYQASSSLFYGLTKEGGTNETGTIFSFDPSTNTDIVLWNFSGAPSDGSGPSGSLIYDENTQLFYGMTQYGGSTGSGTLFSFNPATDSETVLHNFGNPKDGSQPYGSLVYNPTTQLYYGTTSLGGTNTSGTIFAFNPANDSVNVLWSFGSGYDGKTPYGNLVYDPTQELYYVMTSAGGLNGKGAIIGFDPVAITEFRLWDFGSGNDGQAPWGDLVYYPATGLYYGMTSAGGDTLLNDGTIFSFDANADTEIVIVSFGVTDSDGQIPYGNLVLNAMPAGISTVSNIVQAVNIYPNPSYGQFTISGLLNNQIVEIYNYSGQKISSSPAENSTQQFSISTYANGMYLIRILNADGTLAAREKVVKME